MITMNSQILLVSRPSGPAVAKNFRLIEAPLPALRDGQVLVRHHFISVDPYMRGRMNDAKSYAPPQPLNAVMQGGTVGEVVESKHASYHSGDKVVGFGGWQEYGIVDGAAPGVLRKVDTTHVPLSASPWATNPTRPRSVVTMGSDLGSDDQSKDTSGGSVLTRTQHDDMHPRLIKVRQGVSKLTAARRLSVPRVEDAETLAAGAVDWLLDSARDTQTGLTWAPTATPASRWGRYTPATSSWPSLR
ncbi:MAG: hypothetical protein ACRDST_01315 [Pseudonocardiaceae bacterium]